MGKEAEGGSVLKVLMLWKNLDGQPMDEVRTAHNSVFWPSDVKTPGDEEWVAIYVGEKGNVVCSTYPVRPNYMHNCMCVLTLNHLRKIFGL